jgi:hypothetical protein
LWEGKQFANSRLDVNSTVKRNYDAAITNGAAAAKELQDGA